MSQSLLLPATAFADPASYAAASFLARYREATLRAYKQDLRAFFTWCAERDLPPLAAERPHLELYVRWMEQRAYAPSTIGRRFATVGGFYKYAVIDGHLACDPTLAVSRPKVPREGQRRTVLHPLEFAAVLTASRTDGATSHALLALLGMIGLRVSEACHIDVTDLRYQSGYELLSILGKGHKPADIPLPVPVLRAVKEACDGRQAGPLLRNRAGSRLTRHQLQPGSTASGSWPASNTRSVPTACAGRSAPPGSSAASRCATCSTPCGTPTPAPPCATTWPERTWTGTPRTPLPPTSPG